MKHTYTLEELNSTYNNIVVKCNELSCMMYQKGNIEESCLMKEIQNRMVLIHHKAAAVNEFIKVFKALEAKNVDLGDKINGSVSCYYIIFISDLDLDIDNCCPRYFSNMECYELFCRWQKLCGLYKEYFVKTIDLPKSIDLTPYTLVME